MPDEEIIAKIKNDIAADKSRKETAALKKIASAASKKKAKEELLSRLTKEERKLLGFKDKKVK